MLETACTIPKSTDKLKRFVTLSKMHEDYRTTLNNIKNQLNSIQQLLINIDANIERYINFTINNQPRRIQSPRTPSSSEES